MAVVGPGSAVQQDEAPKPTLEGASEYEFVTILNPLTDDFAVRVAQDIPVNMPIEIREKTGLVQNGSDVVKNYGIDLKNKDFVSRKHVINDTIIKAGHTINLKGNEAQVAVKQLVDEILQREGKKRLMADPFLRRSVEDRIIKYRGSMQELMEGTLRTPRTQLDEAIAKSNKEEHEQPFPGLDQPAQKSTERSRDLGSTGEDSQERGRGRPKAA